MSVLNSSWLFLFLCFVTLSDRSQHSKYNPAIEEVRLAYGYAQTVESLKVVDFRNFEFRIFSDRGNTIVIAPLRNGIYEKPWSETTGAAWVKLKWFKMAPDSKHAIVSLAWVSGGGSGSDYGVVQVLSLENKHPVVVQQILFNTRGCENAGAKFSDKNRVLTVRSVHGWEHCCPKILDVVAYGWNGSEFRRNASHSLPLMPNC